METRLNLVTRFVILVTGGILLMHNCPFVHAKEDGQQSASLDRGRAFGFNNFGPSTDRDQNPFGGTAYEEVASSGPGASSVSTAQAGTTSVTVYKEPSGWVISILREMFTDIDWQTIEEARVQIEKFIHRVEQIVGTFRNVFTRGGGASGSSATTTANADLRYSADDGAPSGRWWGKGGDKTSATASKMDATRVKEMLERVACFVGYSRLMNLSNEALAELDASKVVTNLFGSGGKRNSSGWKWFG